jgi:hypothetical protein
MKRSLLGAMLLALLLAAPTPAQDKILSIELRGGKTTAKNVVVTVPLNLPAEWTTRDVISVDLPKAGAIPGQLTAPCLLTTDTKPTAPKLVRRDLTFIVPDLPAEQPLTVKADFGATLKAGSFAWTERPGEFEELSFQAGGEVRPVLRYMCNTCDASTKEKREKSYKVFHHLYDPAGKSIITNGGQTDPGAASQKLLYPHHRGIMYGFMKCTYDGNKQADTWHCTKGAHIAHVKELERAAGPVLGRHRVLLDWYGNETDVFAKEQRELTVYNVPGGTLVEFASRLDTADGKVHIDGDPQHAGFQFRAANEVSQKSAKQTYYLRPDGKGLLGETRNWDPKTKEGPVDLPWDALSYVLGKQRFTVGYLNSPLNPKGSRFSERDYGRFGCYFVYDVAKDHPLLVNYRLWLQDGEMTVEQMQRLYRQFAEPPSTRVK